MNGDTTDFPVICDTPRLRSLEKLRMTGFSFP